MAQISYTNKVALNENPEIANINKVTDDDMNEIKQVVNDNYNNTIIISDTQPTSEDNKIWIDTGEVQNLGSEVHIGDTIDSKVGLNILFNKNLFDKDNATITNAYFDSSTGALINGGGSYVTENYTEVKANTTYIVGNVTLSRVVFYNSSKGVISVTTTSTSFTTPANTKYIRIQITANTSDIIIQKGTSIITPAINVDGEDIYSKPQVLWTNPSPTSAFASQNITLSSEDYDYLEVYYYRATNQKFEKSIKVQKGETFLLTDFATSNNAYPWFRDRTFTYTDSTHYAVGVCYLQFTNANTRSEETTGLIPLKIIGYKE